jgi:hypothetical protein
MLYNAHMYNAFEDLIKAASAPMMAPSAPTEEDHRAHQNKRHYNYRHQAEDVVKRTLVQNPHRSQNIHSYKCPVCKHHENKEQWLVGHKPFSIS